LISSTVASGSAVSLVTATAKTITSVSLTAGDWDVWGMAATKPAGTTTQTIFNAGICTTNNTLPTAPGPIGSATAGGLTALSATFAAGSTIAGSVPSAQFLLSATTTVYLVVNCTFGTSTNTAYGYIAARRRR
jgi:hypothetical protein